MANSKSAKHTVRKSKPPRVFTWYLRKLAIGVLVGLGCLGLSIFVVVHWVERQIFTTDNWVALVSPLPKQPVVSGALGSLISDRVFDAEPVQVRIADALPPQASFLAVPLSSQLKTITTNSATKLVAGDAFQTVWSGANRLAMNRLVTTARNQESPVQSKINAKFDINISDIAGDLQKALGTASSAIPALQPAANKAIDITTDLKTRPHRLRQVVRSADTLAVVLPLFVAACLLTALALSNYRRHTALIAAVTIIILMLTELVAIRWLRQETLNQVNNPDNVPAVTYIFDSLVGWLRHMILWVLAGASVCVVGLLLGGPAKWAVSFRQQLRLDRLHTNRFMVDWRRVRLWTGKWKYYIWLGAVLLVFIGMATLISVNNRTTLNALLLVVSLFALVQIIATPGKNVLSVRIKKQ